MTIESVLDELVRRVTGARAAILLDHQGEVVVEAGERSDEHRLVGAYQGLALEAARSASDRCGAGSVGQLCTRYEEGNVVVQPLKDGYYLVLIAAADSLSAVAAHHARIAAEALNAEI